MSDNINLDAERGVRNARLKLALAVLPFLIALFVFMWVVGSRLSKDDLSTSVGSGQSTNQQIQSIDAIDVEEFLSLNSAALDISPEGRLIINGELKANGAFILTAGGEPQGAVEGQVFYDQDTDEIRYYDGTQFLTLVSNEPGGEVCFVGADNCGFATDADVAALLSQIQAQQGSSIPVTINVSDLTNNGVLLGQGSGSIIATGAPGAGQVLIGNTSGVPTFTSLSGDVSVGGTGSVNINGGVIGAAELSSTGVTAGTYGSATDVPVFTVDVDGRVTSVSNVALGAGGDIFNNGQAGPVVIGTNNATALSLETNNIARLSFDSTGQLTIAGLDCSTNANGGALTANGSGVVSCSDDDGGGSGIASLNGETGAAQTFGNDTNVTIVSGTNTHTLTWAGTLAVARGGTGAATAAGARTNLGAAASGANSDITSLAGLTTALSVAQGGTGSTTVGGARTNLSAAASGANSDITSITGLTTDLSVAQGGTGASTFTSNGVIYGNGAGALQATAAGTTGQCLLGSTGSAPTWSACPGDGTGLADLNGETGGTQTFATGTAGTDFGISSGSNTHTFNIPSASGTARGLVTIAAQTFAGVKTFSSNIIASANLTVNGNTTLGDTGGDLLTVNGNVTLADFDCTGNGNGGALTANGSGVISCSDDDGGDGVGLSSLNGETGGTQTFVNDTNVTISSAANTHSLGWTGTLAVGRGGTGASTLATNGVLYGNGTGAVQTVTGTSGQVLLANGTGVPTFTTLGTDLSVDGTGSVTINANAVALTTDTVGNYLATLTGGNGIGVTGSGSEGATPAVALGALTTTWNQTGAFDIILDNAASNLQIRGSGGAFYASLDAGALTVDETFTLAAGTAGNICTSVGNCAGVGGTGDILNNGQTGPITIGTNNNSNLVLETDNAPRITIGGTGTLTLAGFDCTGNGNGGALTANGSGVISCSDDDGGDGVGISSLNGLSGASQTFANGTNVTITSVGTTHTLGWTGDLAIADGGTGASTAAGARTNLGLQGLAVLNAVSTTEITNDTILAVDLDNTAAPGLSEDNYVLTYDDTTGGFTWVDPSTVGTPQNLFETINTPAGTDPVADGATDTLNFAAGAGVSITGDSGTDTVTIASDLGASIQDGEVDDDLTISGSGSVADGALSANVSLLGSAIDLASEITGTLAVANGGTGATTAGGARTNLGAAASGANSDITSITGLTTDLSIAQGGTNASTAQGAIDNISGLTTQGDLLYYDGTNSTRLARGTVNQCLLATAATIQWGSCTAGGGGFTTLSLDGDSGPTQTISDTDTLNFAGGTNISTVASATDTVTINLENSPTLSGTLTVQGNTSLGNANTDTLTVASAASNITFSDSSLFSCVLETNASGVVTCGTDGGDGVGIADLNGETGGTQSFANDTNVTISSAANTHTLGWAGTLALARGGTGSATAGGARTNLGAAASGANSDITSLSGLTTALSIAQGGTGATTAAGARTNLGLGGLAILSAVTTTEITNDTILAVDLDNTAAPGLSEDNYVLTYDDATGGFTWVDPTTVGGSAQNLFETINTPNGTDPVADGATDTLNLADGAGITITGDSSTDTVTIASDLGASIQDGEVDDDLTISGSGSVADGALSANVSLLGALIDLASEITGTLTVANGGTGSTTAGGARTNLGAAASGANNDITSITGLTTDLSVVQGGTGASSFTSNGVLYGNGTGAILSTAAGATNQCLLGNTGSAPTWGSCTAGGGGFTNLTLSGDSGADQTISDTDTIEIAGGTNIATVAGATDTITINFDGTLPVASGGTGGTTAGAARTNLGAAASGANGDITSLTALTAITPSGALTIGATSQVLTLQGTAATTLAATDSGFTTTVGFGTPTANVGINFPALAAGTYDVCTTSGNCLGGGGGGANTALSNLSSVAINTALLPNVTNAIDLGSDTTAFRTLYLTNSAIFEGSTANGFETTISVEDPTADITYRFADPSGGAGTYDVCTSDGNCVGGGGGGAPNAAAYLTVGADATLSAERAVTAGTNINVADGGANSTFTINVDNDPTFSGLATFNGNILLEATDTFTINGTAFDNLLGAGLQFNSGDLETTLGTSIQDGEVDDDLTISGSGSVADGALSANVSLLGAAIDLASEVTGTLGISGGGTGASTAQAAIDNLSGLTTNGDILYHDGSNATRLARGTNNQCLVSTATTIQWQSCFGSGSGGTLQAAYDAGNTILATDARDIDITLADTATDPSFTIDIATGAGGKFAVQNNGTDALRVDSAGVDLIDVDTADFTGATVTFDANEITDAEVSNTLTASILIGSGSTTNAVDLATAEVSGTLAVANGGTGSTTAGGARTNLGAAASGANSDITSITGLTTDLSVAQGGTGASTFTSNGVLYGNGTGAILSTAAGATNQCLLGNTGSAPTWGSCTAGGGGFTNLSLDGDSGTAETLSDADTINILGGTNITTAVSATDTLTVNLDSSPTLSGDLTVQGNTSLGNANTDTLTIASSAANITFSDSGLQNCVLETNGSGVVTCGTDGGDGVGIADLNGETGGTQSFANDTNVTISSATNTHTLGWTGQLSVARGGTGSSAAGGARTNLGAAASGTNSDITSITGLTTDLSVAQGGTGASTFTSNGILYGNGTGAIQALSVGTTGQCLLGATGSAPTWGACPGDGVGIATLSLDADTGSAEALADSDTITIAGGTNIATVVSSTDTVTINFDGTLAVTDGGTGATTAQGAINGISGLTTNGDLLYHNGTNSTRLARGTTNQCLTSNATTLVWANCFGSGSGGTLQAAYDAGSTIIATDARDIDITLADTATDPSFLVDIAAGSTGRFAVQGSGVDVLSATGAAVSVSQPLYVGSGASATSCSTLSQWGGGCNVQVGVYQSSNTATSGDEINIDNTLVADPSSDSSADFVAQSNLLDIQGSSDLTGAGTKRIAAKNSVYNQNSGTVTDATGSLNIVENTGGGTITSAYGANNTVWNNSGSTIGTAYGTYNEIDSTVGAGSTLTVAYGTFNSVTTGRNSTTDIYGEYSDIRVSGSGSATNVFGTAVDFRNNSSGDVANSFGLHVDAFANTGTGSVTRATGLLIEEQGAATNNTNIVVGQSTIPDGEFSIFNSSTEDNVFAGDLRVGSTVAPTVALDVTGAALISSTLGVTGLSTFDGDLRIADTADDHYITLAVEADESADYTLYIPTEIAADDYICLEVAGNCSGSATTLQATYAADADGSDAIIGLTGADDSLVFRNPASSGTDSDYVLRVEQLNTGGVNGVQVTSAGSDNIFEVFDDGTFTDTTPFVVSASGDVGVGVVAPTAKLEVLGTTLLTSEASGLISGTADPDGTTVLPGSSTAFTTELNVGDRITVNGETRTVVSITNDTSLVVDINFSNTAAAVITRLPATLYALDDSSNASIIATNGLLGVGTAPSTVLHVSGTANDITSLQNGIATVEGNLQTTSEIQSGLTVIPDISPGSASTGVFSGIVSRPISSSVNLGGAVIDGVRSQPEFQGSGNLTQLSGYTSQIWNYSSGTVASAYGLKVDDFDSTTGVNNGTLTNTYGLYVGDITSGMQTNTPYGVYVSDTGVDNLFAGNLAVGSTTRPTVALDITGAGVFSGSVTVGAALNLNATNAIVLDSNAGSHSTIIDYTTQLNISHSTSGGQLNLSADNLNVRASGGGINHISVQSSGTVSFTPTTDSTSSFTVYDKDNNAIVFVDTTNDELEVIGDIRTSGDLIVGDGQGVAFGSGGDATLTYNETVDRVDLTGTNASLFIEDKVGFGKQTFTMVTVGAANENLTISASYVEITGQDNSADTATILTTGAQEGDFVVITNTSATDVAIVQNGTTKIENGANVTLNQFDTITLIFDGTNWIQVSVSLNNS